MDLLATSDFTEQEAREAVDDIKKGINSVRARIYDLDRRKGWKALGYRSFASCCMDQFPELHAKYVEKQLAAARVDAVLQEFPPKGGKIEELPERHARELISLRHDPEALKSAYEKALDIADAENDGRVTTQIITQAVQDVSAKPGDSAWSASELERKKLVLAGKTVVANMHKDSDIALIKWAKENNKFVSIDRKTDWGNPFVMDTSTSKQDGDRDKVCDSYELFFQLKLSLQVRISDLKGCVLGCWCYPNRCHGNFLAEQVNNHEN